ncbi:MAG: hypothetical protein ACFFEM_16435, partial [Candidatus Thorarchaeota archaeon]
MNVQVFTWWVRDVVILKSRHLPSFDEWLENKRYSFLLTNEQWENISKISRKVPDWAIKGVSGLAKSILQEMIT